MTPTPTRSDIIQRSINAPAPAQGRRIMLYGTQLKAFTSGGTVIAIDTIFDPHEIIAYQIRSDTIQDRQRLVDVLISDNPLTDSAAAMRDTRLSGLSGLLVGLPAGVSPLRLPLGLLINRPVTYYKHFAYNNSSGGATLQAIIEIRMMGLK